MIVNAVDKPHDDQLASYLTSRMKIVARVKIEGNDKKYAFIQVDGGRVECDFLIDRLWSGMRADTDIQIFEGLNEAFDWLAEAVKECTP